mgnify:CR=1 FL=1
MRGLVLFLLILVAIVSFSVVALNVDFEKEAKEEAKEFEFSIYTSAVCEDIEDFVHCKDEVFVNCNGEISKVADVAECNGVKLDISQVNGFAVFEKDWKDPRI